MSEFSAAWLALREPADHAARSHRLTAVLATALGRHSGLDVVDLGAGTGSNLRYLAPRLPQPQRWLLVDRDAALLERVRGSAPPNTVVETRALDLARIADSTAHAPFEGRTLVTASALLDLVSASWLNTLAGICAEADVETVMFALTYDGRIECSPRDGDDELVRRLVNDHQRRDKGFGPALGPAAAAHAERAFGERGYRTERAHSDWVIRPDAGELQRELIAGWAAAAIESSPLHLEVIAAWHGRRVQHVEAARSELRVGHDDLLAMKTRFNGERAQSAEPI